MILQPLLNHKDYKEAHRKPHEAHTFILALRLVVAGRTHQGLEVDTGSRTFRLEVGGGEATGVDGLTGGAITNRDLILSSMTT